jgi:hypothetical protein
VTPLATWRLTVAIVGCAIFGWGIRTDNEMTRWVGVACLVLALALRFIGKSRPR